MNRWWKRLLPYTSLALLFIVLAASSPSFLRLENLAAVLRQATVVTIIAIGATLVMIAGEIDLSVGSLAALSGVYTAFALQHWGSTAAGLAAGIASGALLGLMNGVITTRLLVPSFIATLGTMGVFRGWALLVTHGVPVTDIPAAFGQISDGSLFGVLPYPVLALALATAIGYYVLGHTRLGRYCFALGSNRSACVQSGIHARRYVLLIFVVAGAFTGLAGSIETARLISGQPTAGIGYELDAIAAVVIGGGTLTGGEGSIFGTIAGSFVMALIHNGTDLLGISPFVQEIIIGAVIVAVVGLDELRRLRLRRTEAVV
ncbi:MAG: ABC transporter permease [Terriglobales bacterium]